MGEPRPSPPRLAGQGWDSAAAAHSQAAVHSHDLLPSTPAWAWRSRDASPSTQVGAELSQEWTSAVTPPQRQTTPSGQGVTRVQTGHTTVGRWGGAHREGQLRGGQRTDGQIHDQVIRGWVDGQMDRWVSGWTSGWRDVWMDGQMDKEMDSG